MKREENKAMEKKAVWDPKTDAERLINRINEVRGNMWLKPMTEDSEALIRATMQNGPSENGRYRELYTPKFLVLFPAQPVEELSAEQYEALKTLRSIAMKLTKQYGSIIGEQQHRIRQDRRLEDLPPDEMDTDLLAYEIFYVFWNRFNCDPEGYEVSAARCGKLGIFLRCLMIKDR